jgi:integrase
MASVRKRGKVYHYRFKDSDGVWVSRSGLPSREATLKIALAAEERARLEREGLIDPAKEAARTGLDELLDKWESWLRSLKRTADYTRTTILQCRAVVRASGADRLAQLTPGAIQTAIGELRDKQGFGASTFVHYRASIGHFLAYLETEGMLAKNPIAKVETPSVEADRRYLRRPLSPGEVRRLMDAALARPGPLQGHSGPDRAWLYAVFYFTGYRKKEVNSLTPESFDLDGPSPVVRLKAADAKARRKADLPFPAEYVPAFRAWLATKPPGKPPWRLRSNATIRMMAKDLKAAGIPYRDEQGRCAGLHGFRMTRSTLLVRAGFDVKTVQAASRHKDVKMTLETYTAEAGDEAVRGAVDHLAGSLPKPDVLGAHLRNGAGPEGGDASTNDHDERNGVLRKKPGSSGPCPPASTGGRLEITQNPAFVKAIALEILAAKVALLRRICGARSRTSTEAMPCEGG